MTLPRRLKSASSASVPGFALPMLATLIFLISPASAERDDPYEEINDGWDRFGSVYKRVIEHYYTPVDHRRVMRSAIDGLLRELDDYSQYYDEEGLRQLRQDTTGKFAGLGITVGIMDSYPVVIAPIEGTPASRAGVQPGDLIVAIEGKDTFGLSLETIVNELRGEPGSPVSITLHRRGVARDWDVRIVREVITIRSVAVADLAAPGVGYISLRQTRFSEDTASEVEGALDDLFARDIEGLIVDLRGNPGGLLSQASEVADLFLERGAPIVSVRERAGRNEETRVSQRRPPAAKIPLVVLIDGGSASAAEIVAGAIQDNDRGVVLGTPSFGKGSVQTIFDLRDDDEAALKLTTALYYTPSGRSIHKSTTGTPADPTTLVPVGGARLPAAQLINLLLQAPDPTTAEDQLRARFGLEAVEARRLLATSFGELVSRGGGRSARTDSARVEFHTGRGRAVFGGGGITPDITVDADIPPDVVIDLYRHRVFFDFVTTWVGETDDTIVDVDDDMLHAFRAFADTSEAAKARREHTRSELQDLRTLASHAGWDGSILARIDSLEAAVDRQEAALPLTDEVLPYVRAALRRELAVRTDGRRASLLVDLDTDPQVLAAIDLLRDAARYRRLLQATAAD
jgi:carboxyl-terminal processing protease